MKPLLPPTHPTYLRRFVRVLNQQGMLNGFFPPHPFGSNRVRCNRARLRDGQLQCRVIGGGWINTLNPNYPYETPSAVVLYASRTP